MRPGFIFFGENAGTGVPGGPKGKSRRRGRKDNRGHLEKRKERLTRKIANGEKFLASGYAARLARLDARKAKVTANLSKWKSRLDAVLAKLAALPGQGPK